MLNWESLGDVQRLEINIDDFNVGKDLHVLAYVQTVKPKILARSLQRMVFHLKTQTIDDLTKFLGYSLLFSIDFKLLEFRMKSIYFERWGCMCMKKQVERLKALCDKNNFNIIVQVVRQKDGTKSLLLTLVSRYECNRGWKREIRISAERHEDDADP